jgi:hypothetical protein
VAPIATPLSQPLTAAVQDDPWQVPPLQLCADQMLAPGWEPDWQTYWTESPWVLQEVPPTATPLSQPDGAAVQDDP